MVWLNIFFRSNGSFAWENILILLAAFGIGYLVRRWLDQKSINKSTVSASGWETKYKHVDTEYRSYKSNIAATTRHHEKAVGDLTLRTKALEGDIKALAEEKNKLNHLVGAKDEEIKKYSRQVSMMEDKAKEVYAENESRIAEISAQLKKTKEELAKALVWEERVKGAEEEARKAKSALSDIQRRTLEFDMRLKAASEYAAKVQPLEAELKALKEKYAAFQDELASKDNVSGELNAKMEKLNVSIEMLQKEKSQFIELVSKKDIEIAALQSQLKSTSEAASRVTGLQTEIKLIQGTNKALQQELADKTALLNKLQSAQQKVETANPTLQQVVMTDPANVGSSVVVTDDFQGEGEES
jgi:chromosome segregation ATPase